MKLPTVRESPRSPRGLARVLLSSDSAPRIVAPGSDTCPKAKVLQTRQSLPTPSHRLCDPLPAPGFPIDAEHMVGQRLDLAGRVLQLIPAGHSVRTERPCSLHPSAGVGDSLDLSLEFLLRR